MSVVLKTIDQVLGSPVTEGPRLSFAAGATTARAIVQARVHLEVARANGHEPADAFAPLFTPAEEESALNGPHRAPRRALDVGRQIEVALDAVRRGRVIILFNGTQVTDIDAPLDITPVSEARFLKLVPLAGG